MTTSILNSASSTLALDSPASAVTTTAAEVSRVPHSLASRFIFLLITTAIVMTTLAYGTVHYWALAVLNLSAVAVLILWVIDAWSVGSLRISRNPLQLPVLGMLILGLIQLLPLRTPDTAGALTIGPVKTLSLDPYSTRFALAQVAALLVYFAAVLVFTDTPHRLRLLVRTIIIFGFFLAIFGMTQSVTSPTKIYWMRELKQSTAFGPFINRHHFAGYMEMTIALPLGLLFSGALDKDMRYIYLFAAILMGLALILTGSRGGIISLFCEIVFLVAIAGFRKRHKHRESEWKKSRMRSAALRAGLALALIVALFTGVVLLGGESALSRLTGSINADDPTTGRAHFWSVTLDIIRTNPILGTGLGAFGVVYTRYDSASGMFRTEQAHNDYLQVLSDGGIVGGIIGLCFLILLFRMGFARRDSRDNFRRGVAIGALAGTFGVLIHSFFDFTLHTTANALLFLTIAALATLNGRVEKPSALRRRKRSRASSAESEETTTEAGAESASPEPATSS
jgi:O-antigen ligase